MEDNAPRTNAEVIADNNVDSFVLTHAGNGVYTGRVLKNYNNSGERIYTYKVTGTIDQSLSENLLSYATKSAIAYFYSVKYYSYREGTPDQELIQYVTSSAVYVTQHVREGSNASIPSDPYLGGLSFAFWSEEGWTQDEDDTTISHYGFDLPDGITAPLVLYSH